jgi:putative ABC transport system ATP-binding protein
MTAAPPAAIGGMTPISEDNPPAVELRDVTKAYPGPVVALDQVSLQVRRGQAVAVVGASGSGKSTLLNLMGTLDAPTTGEVLIDGHRTEHLADRQLAGLRSHYLGFVFQHFHLSDRLTALDNVASGLLYCGVARRQRRALALAALDMVGIGRRAGNLPYQLSGGERQRVAIARAVVHRPLLLLADEPTGALDSATGRAVLDLLLELHRIGTTLVVITHDPNIAARLPARVQVADGHIRRVEGLWP